MLQADANKLMQHITNESPIDRFYREEFLSKISNADCKQNGFLWSFACPFCSQQQSKDWKRRKKTACLLWSAIQNSWKFSCQRCEKKTNFFHMLRDFDSILATRYQREREQAGTTGWGHDCPSPHLMPGSTPSQKPSHVQATVIPEEFKEQVTAAGSSVTHLPRLTPQQQSGHQSHLNQRVKQHQQSMIREPGDFWLG